MKFKAKLKLHGKTATGFEVPPEVVEELGAGKKPPVQVTINGYTWRSTIAPRGGIFLIGISAVNREGAGVAAGDLLEVGLELDTEMREVEVPPQLAVELARDAKAKAVWDSLSYTQRREHAESITGAKKPETRERRLAKTMKMLREGRKS